MATTNSNFPRFREGEDLNCYLEQLEECFKLNKTLEADKVSVLLTSIDVNVYKTLRDLLVPRRPSDLKYKLLVEVLTNHLYPMKNKHFERYLFHKIVQKENEPVGKFVLRLKSQADKCKFTDINENLCDQFVSGCFDEATLKRLLSEPFLTFDSAIIIANSVEAAKSQVNLMKNPGHDIDKLKARSKNFKFPCKYNNPCKICGKSNHDTKLCKFKNAQCYICNKKGHIAPVCWNKKSAQNSGMNKPNQNKLNTIQCNTLENAPKIMVNVKIEDADTIMEVDTGADVSVVSKKFFLTNLKNVTLEKYSGHLKSFSGNMIPVFGKCLVNVSYKNYQEKLPLIVTGQFNNQTPLLGRNWIRILKADWPNCVFDICNNINVISNLELFLEVYKRVFEDKDLPIQGIKGSISLRPNAKPKFFKFRPVPFSIKEKIDKELDRLEKSQIIEKVNASDWSTPLVTVIKSNGELRLCGDFKNTLNNCIEDEKYPLPTIETMLGNLGGNKIFTKLDLSSAYHQIEMDEASKNLLVVSSHRGLYRYNRLPFGISPASAIFQRCMDSLFHDVPNTVIYLDDIFIGSKDEQEHYRILKIIFDKLKELNFTLNKEKCLFLKKDICFLGHIINEDGVRPDSKKLEALERCKKPFDKTSLKSFLGMLSFYSKYIPNMSTLAGPLYQLLKKDNRWKWSSQCEKAFLNLKLTLLNSQALIHYSMKLPLTLTCDASAYGISGVLCHIVEGEEKPITFVSRTLSSAEVKYSQTEKEALAIVFATSKLRQYLFGRKFVLKSDHKALTTVFGNKRLLPPLIANRLHRWALELSNFDFDIRYTNKDTMLCADAFSRLPLEEINSWEDNIDLVTHDISFLNVTPLDHLIIEEETNKDPVLNKLKEYLLEDPQLAKKDETMKPFLSKLENFSVLQGCIFVDSRAVIPSTCQDQMLKLLHQSHIGINRMKSLARSSVWWPKMDSQIEEFVKECSPCMHHQTAPPAENTPWPRTNQPWQRVHVDHFYFRGDCYLLVVDANSNWIEVFPVRGTTSQENIKLLRECFARNTPTSLDKPPVERLLSYVPRTFVNCLNSEFIQKTFGRNECGRRHFQVGDKVMFTRVIQNRRKWFKAQVIRRLGYNVYLVKNLKGTFKVHVNQMRTGSDTKYAEDSDWTLDNAGAGPHRLEQDPQISTTPPPRRSTRPRRPPCRQNTVTHIWNIQGVLGNHFAGISLVSNNIGTDSTDTTYFYRRAIRNSDGTHIACTLFQTCEVISLGSHMDDSSNGLGYVAQMKEPSVFSRNYYLVVQNYLRILEFWAQNIELEVDEDHSMLPCTHSIYCCAPSHTEEFEERQVSPMARMKVTPTRYHAPETPPPIFSPKKEEEVVAATASTHNPHRCRFCDYSSRWKQNVINHQYTHTGEKPYQCQHCNYKTTQQSRLKQHTYVHTKEKPYRCQHCSFTTAYGSYLKIHIQKNHSPSEQSPTALYHPFDITSLLSRCQSGFKLKLHSLLMSLEMKYPILRKTSQHVANPNGIENYVCKIAQPFNEGNIKDVHHAIADRIRVLREENKRVRVNKIINTRTSISDEKESNFLKDELCKSTQLTNICKTFIPTKRDPTIMVKNVSKITEVNSFEETICQMNDELKDMKSEIKVLFCTKSNTSTHNIVLRVSPRVYQTIKKLNNKIYTDCERCVVVDRFLVKQCQKCLKFNPTHKTAECPNTPICRTCGVQGVHDCSGIPKCFNCSQHPVGSLGSFLFSIFHHAEKSASFVAVVVNSILFSYCPITRVLSKDLDQVSQFRVGMLNHQDLFFQCDCEAHFKVFLHDFLHRVSRVVDWSSTHSVYVGHLLPWFMSNFEIVFLNQIVPSRYLRICSLLRVHVDQCLAICNHCKLDSYEELT
ncbi:K02A2.6-like [Cordylochernes scorpioides]|uniref:RNA-directed DNA polymerase n=1 Tax=Cordylochernes scorpioides TaxID=51811 RepID=A0ABY6KXI0_9ARAC|nr:K02A2.6-like [Cordylochernes scorpioides]